MSSLDSMLNSASTIFTMDLYRRHFRPDASPKNLVGVGRIMTGLFVIVGCAIAPNLGNPRFGGIFKYIQMFQGFISPGILTVFVVGLIFRKAPPLAAVVGLLLNIPVYGLLLWLLPDVAFLNHMAITFGVILAAMLVITLVRPMTEPKKMPVNENIDLKASPAAMVMGAAIVAVTIALYVIFW
jgi:SSS family solute:Na+ symporter